MVFIFRTSPVLFNRGLHLSTEQQEIKSRVPSRYRTKGRPDKYAHLKGTPTDSKKAKKLALEEVRLYKHSKRVEEAAKRHEKHKAKKLAIEEAKYARRKTREDALAPTNFPVI